MHVGMGGNEGWANWSRGFGGALTMSTIPMLFPLSKDLLLLNLILISWSISRITNRFLETFPFKCTNSGKGVSVSFTLISESIILLPR